MAERAAQEYAENPAPVGAWLTPKELRRRNRELAKYGRRICRTHQGAALPLDSEHFYYANRAIGQFDTECKHCFKARDKRNKLERYHADPQWRARFLAKNEARRQRRRSEYLAQRADYRRRKKAERLAAVLDKAVAK
jgi:hypothetical protein